MLLCCSGAQLRCFVLELPGKGDVALFLLKDHCNFCTTASSQFSCVWAGQRGSLGAAYRALSGFFVWGCTMERCFYKLHVMADGMEMVHLKTWSPHFSSSNGCQSLGSLHLMGCGDLRATTATFSKFGISRLLNCRALLCIKAWETSQSLLSAERYDHSSTF